MDSGDVLAYSGEISGEFKSEPIAKPIISKETKEVKEIKDIKEVKERKEEKETNPSKPNTIGSPVPISQNTTTT